MLSLRYETFTAFSTKRPAAYENETLRYENWKPLFLERQLKGSMFTVSASFTMQSYNDTAMVPLHYFH